MSEAETVEEIGRKEGIEHAIQPEVYICFDHSHTIAKREKKKEMEGGPK